MKIENTDISKPYIEYIRMYTFWQGRQNQKQKRKRSL